MKRDRFINPTHDILDMDSFGYYMKTMLSKYESFNELIKDLEQFEDYEVDRELKLSDPEKYKQMVTRLEAIKTNNRHETTRIFTENVDIIADYFIRGFTNKIYADTITASSVTVDRIGHNC